MVQFKRLHEHQSKYINSLVSLSLVVMMGRTMIMPSLTIFAKQDLGAVEFLVGAVIAGVAIGRSIFDTPNGFLADKLVLNKTMILGL